MVADALGRDLVVLEHAARRTPVAAATGALMGALLARAATLPKGGRNLEWVNRAVHKGLLSIFRRLPRRAACSPHTR